MKDSVVFYKSFYDAIKKIPEEYQLELYNAIFMYSFEDIEPTNLSSIAEVIFTLTKPNIDSAQRKYKASVENGNKGGRPKKNNPDKTQLKPNNNPDKTQLKPKSEPNHNLNDNVNVNETVTVYVNGNDTALLSYEEVLAIAKEECPKIYERHTSKCNNKMNMSTERKVFALLDKLNGIYTYQQLRELFKKSSKMYCSQDKYDGCDLVWLLSNLQEIEKTQLEEEKPEKVVGYMLSACDLEDTKI